MSPASRLVIADKLVVEAYNVGATRCEPPPIAGISSFDETLSVVVSFLLASIRCRPWPAGFYAAAGRRSFLIDSTMRGAP